MRLRITGSRLEPTLAELGLFKQSVKTLPPTISDRTTNGTVSLSNLAVYIGDAVAQELPLVSMSPDGGGHDWYYLLDHFNLLAYDLRFALLTRQLSFVVLAASFTWGLWTCLRPAPEPVAPAPAETKPAEAPPEAEKEKTAQHLNAKQGQIESALANFDKQEFVKSFNSGMHKCIDYGKAAATFIDTLTGKAVRIVPSRASRQLAMEYAPEAVDKWHAMLLGYQRIPDADLSAVRGAAARPYLAGSRHRPML